MNKTEKKIEKLRRKAKKHYLAYKSILNDFDCGAVLAEAISSELYNHRMDFNRTMDELALLDPSTPEKRLL